MGGGEGRVGGRNGRCQKCKSSRCRRKEGSMMLCRRPLLLLFFPFVVGCSAWEEWGKKKCTKSPPKNSFFFLPFLGKLRKVLVQHFFTSSNDPTSATSSLWNREAKILPPPFFPLFFIPPFL